MANKTHTRENPTGYEVYFTSELAGSRCTCAEGATVNPCAHLPTCEYRKLWVFIFAKPHIPYLHQVYQ